ncbi:hypothetical protein ON010_g13454 [Phytophthora cinnamomi]|nr:hypothetical protein ON010_g13454 [Phytophthora cinnamomi]
MTEVKTQGRSEEGEAEKPEQGLHLLRKWGIKVASSTHAEVMDALLLKIADGAVAATITNGSSARSVAEREARRGEPRSATRSP